MGHSGVEPEKDLEGGNSGSPLSSALRSNTVLQTIGVIRMHALPIEPKEQPRIQILYPDAQTIIDDITPMIESELDRNISVDLMMFQASSNDMSLSEYAESFLKTEEQQHEFAIQVHLIVDEIIGIYDSSHQTLILPKRVETETVFSNVLGYIAASFIRRAAESTKCSQEELASLAGMQSVLELHKWLHTVGLSAIDTSCGDDSCALNIHEAIVAIAHALSTIPHSGYEQMPESRKIG